MDSAASAVPKAPAASAGSLGPRVHFAPDVTSPVEGEYYEAFVPKRKGSPRWKEGEWWITQMRKASDQGEWRVCWEFQDHHKGGGWREFHSSLSIFVEGAFLLGHKSCERHIVETKKPGHHNYRWDLNEWKQYRQIDGKIVATKNIRRILLFVPHSASWAESRIQVC